MEVRGMRRKRLELEDIEEFIKSQFPYRRLSVRETGWDWDMRDLVSYIDNQLF